ncbi:helix-turn-helix domain-containing protein [Solibacillus sp. A46]|uniref:Helix-turn-helix domain-containing protein n=1 Tax=Solibacillus faecavium TaxID=2762221 RepID=A0ABR8XYV5_9BACL|nr:helix-turn-helix transcriptional regulator [Solibacillus faecavium]MBD8037130.1 helix-turn-helix domain-containing protein [Solibacillus faecavium]
MTEFGAYIKKIRDSKGMTLNQLALYAEISAAQLSRIETGKRGTPKPQTIEKIAQALKVDYTELMKVAGYVDSESADIKKDKIENDIAKRLKQFEKEIENSDGLAFDGEPMSDEAKESLLESMELLFRQTQRINKKYTPKKYRDDE